MLRSRNTFFAQVVNPLLRFGEILCVERGVKQAAQNSLGVAQELVGLICSPSLHQLGRNVFLVVVKQAERDVRCGQTVVVAYRRKQVVFCILEQRFTRFRGYTWAASPRCMFCD